MFRNRKQNLFFVADYSYPAVTRCGLSLVTQSVVSAEGVLALMEASAQYVWKEKLTGFI